MEESGCWWEAERCDRVATYLIRLRRDLNGEYDDEVTALLAGVESTSRILRDAHDLFPFYRPRVLLVLYYLHIVLPCLSRTLRDMMIYISHDELPPSRKWVLMNERLSDQGGMPLASRFVIYFDFLVQCIRLLTRSFLYDPAVLESLRTRILRLRRLRMIPEPPRPLQPHVAPPTPTRQDIEQRHWAEKIFDEQPSTTGLRHRRVSRCFGPPMVEESLGIPRGSSVLFKLPFDKNRLSVTLYLNAEGADMTRLLCRWMDPQFNPMYSCYGVHELCIRRKGSSLQFRRWNNNRAHSTLWLALFFKTWEKMVLFHATFVALKARCPLTVAINPDDYRLSGEEELFQGKIIDDGFEHTLSVFQDKKCHGLRLHAAVLSGVLRKCPVWTAFVTYSSASPNWLIRRSAHRIRINDIHPYVFCKEYDPTNQIHRGGKFEICFFTERSADEFEDLFREPSEQGSVMESQDPPEGGGGDGDGDGGG
ncbi:hypothetical protein M430DRAFT_34496 [Amorphotheca resinae ATCC 22711]|uniref:Uncharacterized protein n=1 Tax=Amorphotheca resinae ATCC 22711 TaxID=857342 RepID=A0A2T3B3A6_AMORE|nr:hypothetical protein M430DRAFT_34496 [Amorphotheca resinae ATCC 22711]PSS20120.1 hypothetical protein M430DRAFT_34496 [Amorphotheca resinae ATCC 22711]